MRSLTQTFTVANMQRLGRNRRTENIVAYLSNDWESIRKIAFDPKAFFAMESLEWRQVVDPQEPDYYGEWTLLGPVAVHFLPARRRVEDAVRVLLSGADQFELTPEELASVRSNDADKVRELIGMVDHCFLAEFATFTSELTVRYVPPSAPAEFVGEDPEFNISNPALQVYDSPHSDGIGAIHIDMDVSKTTLADLAYTVLSDPGSYRRRLETLQFGRTNFTFEPRGSGRVLPPLDGVPHSKGRERFQNSDESMNAPLRVHMTGLSTDEMFSNCQVGQVCKPEPPEGLDPFWQIEELMFVKYNSIVHNRGALMEEVDAHLGKLRTPACGGATQAAPPADCGPESEPKPES